MKCMVLFCANKGETHFMKIRSRPKIAEMFIVIVHFLIYVILSVNCWTIAYDPDGDLSLNDLVVKLGYDGIESFYGTTPDGYIINVQHIKRQNASTLMPVLFVHGLSACADSFFGKKNQSAPIVLANNGYDVWLLNNRGTFASSNHTLLKKNDKNFWGFSWQETGIYDLPLAIDIVLNNNNHEQLILIGHSEGSTITFVTLSERPEYNDKVALSIHWGASVYHQGCSTVKLISVLCRIFEPLIPDLQEALGIFGTTQLLNLKETFKLLCRYEIFKQACFEMAKNLLQSEVSQIEHVDDWSFYIEKSLCGGTLRELQHYMQVGLTGRFARYSYGPKKNLVVYNSTEPPLFHLENVKSPVVLWCGRQDIFCTNDDVMKLRSKLKNVETTYFKGYKLFSHIDYLVAKDVDKYIYRDTLALMKKYSN